MEQVEEKEEMVVAFSWRIHDLPASLATLTEERPLTSGDIHPMQNEKGLGAIRAKTRLVGPCSDYSL